MALVKCPECGKENISDSAPTCPVCGYGIKEHFERQKQKVEFAEQQQRKKDSLQKELEKKLKEIDNMAHPYRPTWGAILSQGRNWFFPLVGSIALLTIILSILCIFVGEKRFPLDVFLGGSFFGVLAYVSGKDVKRDYDNALYKYKNWDEHREKLKIEVENWYESKINDLNAQEFEPKKNTIIPERATIPQPSYGLKCPVCGSRNVKRISNTSRAISVELMGLASSKIGKQYECKSCQHKW